MVQSILTAEFEESIPRHKVIIVNCSNIVSLLVHPWPKKKKKKKRKEKRQRALPSNSTFHTALFLFLILLHTPNNTRYLFTPYCQSATENE